MDMRILLLICVILTFEAVKGGFFYNPLPPTNQQIEERGLKCIPGRTVIRIEEIKELKEEGSSSAEETRRSHMNAVTKDESCKICVCSVEGKDEYCKVRPARNVNECVRMAIFKKNIEKYFPFSHERSLSFRIRRDYIWHYDEIPYEPKAACRRGTSYYTNNINAVSTDIDVPSDVDSLLDYSNKDVCFYCVCSVNGRQPACMNRDSWFCDYYRILREPGKPREKYRQLFQQDRPAYFRHLSYRLRRMMDDGMVAFLDIVGDQSNNSKCVPYVSEYSDCTEANACSGCTRCSCTENREWNCQMVFECPTHDDDTNSEAINVALDMMFSELKNKDNRKKPHKLVPPPPKPEDELIVSENNPYEESFESFFSRKKRSISDHHKDDKSNNTIKFYHTIDELNEDTLKYSNKSGTIETKKIDANHISKISRRTGLLNSLNKSSLHIEYNQPEEYDHHIAENKIEATDHTGKLDLLLKNKLEKFIANFSHTSKDADLSKVVVNELKPGSEIIGDKNVSPMSNITFTPENDTSTALAFIAGNLLNKLWDMEQDSSDGLVDTEVLKHEKINDLLELFKEPLNLRQEMFLKNALEKLSNTLNKNKNIKNVSFCETIVAQDKPSNADLNINYEKSKTNKSACDQKQFKTNEEQKLNKTQNTTDLVNKLSNVLNLIKKFERAQNELNNFKPETNIKHSDVSLTPDETTSLHTFGHLLEKITKLIVPNNLNQKITNNIRSLNQLKYNENKNNKSFKEKLNSNLSAYSFTLKDKIILDYLKHIEDNPHCLLRENLQETHQLSPIKVDGNILYNLNELIKVNSFIDLVKLINSDKDKKNIKTQTTESSVTGNVTKDSVRIYSEPKLNTTKEKLKNHLKAIIDDLLELQNDSTYLNQNKINIADVLPCIYNIMNSEKVFNNSVLEKPRVSSLNKIKTLIDALKVEFTSNHLTRRTNTGNEESSQSAKIWERVVNNIIKLQKNRRSSNQERPKSFEELKSIIDKIESTGNSYKNFALLSVVPPHNKLMLLKTLEADTKQNAFALENIRKSFDNLIKLPSDKLNEIKEFIDNTENSMHLSVNVLKNLSHSKQNINDQPLSDLTRSIYNMEKLRIKSGANINNNIKLTRDQIIIKLIENRIKLYLASKKEKNTDLSSNMNYNIGKRILAWIEKGNINLAKELFEIFVANQRKEVKKINNHATSLNQDIKLKQAFLPYISLTNEPPKKEIQSSPDFLFKQLLSLKNMNLK